MVEEQKSGLIEHMKMYEQEEQDDKKIGNHYMSAPFNKDTRNTDNEGRREPPLDSQWMEGYHPASVTRNPIGETTSEGLPVKRAMTAGECKYWEQALKKQTVAQPEDGGHLHTANRRTHARIQQTLGKPTPSVELTVHGKWKVDLGGSSYFIAKGELESSIISLFDYYNTAVVIRAPDEETIHQYRQKASGKESEVVPLSAEPSSSTAISEKPEWAQASDRRMQQAREWVEEAQRGQGTKIAETMKKLGRFDEPKDQPELRSGASAKEMEEAHSYMAEYNLQHPDTQIDLAQSLDAVRQQQGRDQAKARMQGTAEPAPLRYGVSDKEIEEATQYMKGYNRLHPESNIDMEWSLYEVRKQKVMEYKRLRQRQEALGDDAQGPRIMEWTQKDRDEDERSAREYADSDEQPRPFIPGLSTLLPPRTGLPPRHGR